MISSKCWHVGRLTHGPRPQVWLTLTVNSPAPSRRCPPDLPSGPPNRRCPKVLLRSFNKAKGLCPTQSSPILFNLRGGKSKLLRVSPFTSLHFPSSSSSSSPLPSSATREATSAEQMATSSAVRGHARVPVCACVRVCAHLAYSAQIAQMLNSLFWSQTNSHGRYRKIMIMKTLAGTDLFFCSPRQKDLWNITFEVINNVKIVLETLLNTMNSNYL